MAQVTTCPSPTRQPAPLRVAPSTAARSRATEGFSATTATRPAESGFSGIERYGVSARSRELKPVLVVGDRGYRALAAINRPRADGTGGGARVHRRPEDRCDDGPGWQEEDLLHHHEAGHGTAQYQAAGADEQPGDEKVPRRDEEPEPGGPEEDGVLHGRDVHRVRREENGGPPEDRGLRPVSY